MPKSILSFIVGTVLLLTAPRILAQDTVIELNNGDIVTMVKAKLPPEIIIEKIRNSRCHFDTFPSVLAELKYKGVPDTVLAAMLDATIGGSRRQAENRREQTVNSRSAAEVFNTTPASTAALTNLEVIKMLGSGLSPTVVETAIKSRSGNYDTSANALLELKKAGATDPVIVALLQAAKVPAQGRSNSNGRITDELTTSFQVLQNSVVTVWSEIGHGTGFIFDKAGLVMTNQHVIGPSEYIAVQFDEKHKVYARVLATDPEKDVAILWINLEGFPEARPASLANSNGNEPTVIEGERVLTIGSPLHQMKVMTTGVVSKVEQRAIISDVNINHGNSGGPLFNSLGEVVGITTFGDFTRRGGPGISGIVRIEETYGVIARARSEMKGRSAPIGAHLPVEPANRFPLDAIKNVVLAEKFDSSRYFFEVGEFQVSVITPPLTYRMQTEASREAAKTKNKRNDKNGAIQGTIDVLDDFQGWREYVGDYRPVVMIQATPKMGESFWGGFARQWAAAYGVHAQANIRFKTDFYQMKLFCGDKEIMPIHPGKIAHIISESNYLVRAKDATYEGLYTYPPGAITSGCGRVRLEIFSERNPEKANGKNLDEKTIARIDEDFAPYFQRFGRPTLFVR